MALTVKSDLLTSNSGEPNARAVAEKSEPLIEEFIGEAVRLSQDANHPFSDW